MHERYQKRGFSLVEVVVALVILAVMLVPLLELVRPARTGIGPRQSSSAHLLHEVAQVVRRMPRGVLYPILAAAPEAEAGFREVSFTALAVGTGRFAEGLLPDGVRPMGTPEDLRARLFVRLNAHVGESFALDRLDLVLVYHDSRDERVLRRSVVRPNETALMGLAELRAAMPLENLDDAAFRERLAIIVRESADLAVARRAPGTPWMVPVYPERLRELDPPEHDERAMEEASAGMDRYLQARSQLLGGVLSPGEAPRPRIAPGLGLCH